MGLVWVAPTLVDVELPQSMIFLEIISIDGFKAPLRTLQAEVNPHLQRSPPSQYEETKQARTSKGCVYQT